MSARRTTPRRQGAASPLRNEDVARRLRELALFLEMEGVPYRPRAYEKAALAVEALQRPVAEIDAEQGAAGLDALPSIGKGIARRIEEILRTGTLAELERLRRKHPVDVLGLTAIEGLGPKKLRALHEALGVRSVADLAEACRTGRVRGLRGFGARSEARFLRGIELLEQGSGRHLLGSVWSLAEAIEARLAGVRGVTRACVAGSFRRRRETVGDLDFLAVASASERAMVAFAGMPEVEHVHARGETKALVRLRGGIDADLRVVPAESFGAALLYFTGSKAHNVALRRRAQARGWLLNEYGLFAGERRLAGDDEAGIYERLGLRWIPPELREDRGEIEAAEAGRLPVLLEHGDLRGDLQVQTSWSDGAASIEEMVEAARALGLEYLAVTDHTRDLAMARGLDEERLRAQADAVRKLDRRLRGFRVLTGAEVNLRADGSLDVDDAALAELDVVGAAVHSHFDLPRDAQTRRVLRALEHPHVDVLFHPSGRALGRRPPIALDWDAVFAAAHRTGTVLEVDGMPDRMDLRDEQVRAALQAGVRLAVDSDAHRTAHLEYADRFGVATARRGWATRDDVVNAWPVERMLASLKGARGRRAGRRRRPA
jgi:DNA polymerase (family 10)